MAFFSMPTTWPDFTRYAQPQSSFFLPFPNRQTRLIRTFASLLLPFFHSKQSRLERFESSARSILSASPSIASWVRPTAGMFLWIKLKLPPSGGAGAEGEGDSFELISNKAKAAGVLALPGVAFMPPSNSSETSSYVRTSFSQVPLDQVDTAFRRLRAVVEEAWKEAGLDIPV